MEEIDEETLKQMENDNTIEGLIKLKELEEKATDEYFNCIWELYHLADKNRKMVIKSLKQVSVHLKLTAFLLPLINRKDLQEEVFKLIEFLKSNMDEVIKEKKLFELINIILEKLGYRRIIEPENNIYSILNLLDEKNELIYNSSVESIQNLSTRISGIDVVKNDKSEKLNEIDEKIDSHLLILGLKK